MDNCPIHNQPYKLVPAGISKKTGKGYPAFYTCPEFGCTQKPPKEDTFESDKQDFLNAVEPPKAPEKPESTDSAVWDAKDRMNMAQSALKAAAEIVAAMITIGKIDADSIITAFEDLKEKNYKWLMEKKNG